MMKNVKILALVLGIAALPIGGGITALLLMRYGNMHMDGLTLDNHPVSDEPKITGESVQFIQNPNGTYSVDFELTGENSEAQLSLQNIDLSLFIPTVPRTARGDAELARWFLSEREFNRQRVMFQAGSEHIDAPGGLAGYAAEDLAIALTNNCLGAGYWELAVYVEDSSEQRKIYQGYFDFPRGAYSQLVESTNADTQYWQQARSMEGWIGFNFNRGMSFNLDRLRSVTSEWVSTASDRADSSVVSFNEQQSKASLIASAEPVDKWETYRELRQQPLQFQSFVPPGIYDPERLWPSNFAEIDRMIATTVRSIATPLSDETLLEMELEFLSADRQARYLVVSGIDLDSVPQLPVANYSDGIYRPLGFGVPFTQDYAELEQARPENDPFFSVLLDEHGKVMDYRGDVGINGLVLHRDVDDPNLVHLYLMSYERIVLVGHYVVDVGVPNQMVSQVPQSQTLQP